LPATGQVAVAGRLPTGCTPRGRPEAADGIKAEQVMKAEWAEQVEGENDV